uniref:Gag protein n=1 Tax=Cacopsylla melanoneura TaxID=428564 RepID=A0A8D8QBN2_9HEMI
MAPTLLQQAKSYHEGRKRYFERIERCHKLMNANRDGEFFAMLPKVEDAYEKFENCTDELICLNNQVDSKERFEISKDSAEFEDLYFAIKAYAAALRENNSPGVPTISDNNQPREVSIKLPVVNMPSFGGDITEFPAWRSLYEELIHNNQALSDIQKFSYLKSYLVGSAKITIDSVPFISANYPLAYRTLRERYAKKRILARSLVNKMLKFKPLPNDNVSGLCSFLDQFEVAVQTLKGLRVPDLGDFILSHMALCVLDEKSSLEFETKYSKVDFPTFETIVNFVKDKCAVLEENRESGSMYTSATRFRTDSVRPQNSGFQPRKSFVVAAVEQEGRNVGGWSCPMCQTNDHKLSQCQIFLKMEPSNRFNVVKDLNLCFACFSYSHSRNECSSNYRCRTCNANTHHSLLHPEGISQGGYDRPGGSYGGRYSGTVRDGQGVLPNNNNNSNKEIIIFLSHICLLYIFINCFYLESHRSAAGPQKRTFKAHF